MSEAVAPPTDGSVAAPTELRDRRRPFGTPVVAELGYGAALTLALAALGLFGGGGLSITSSTWVELSLLAASAVLGGVAVLAAGSRAWWGSATFALFTAYAALSATSILWAVDPSEAWLEANRVFAWVAVFGSGIALVRTCGQWWSATLGAVVAAAVIVCGWALLTKIFPEALAEDEIFARLREPYEYWNAVGLTASLGIIAATWLGARRSGNGLASALAFPAIAILTTALLLAYSRGALLALLVALTVWLIVVPLRLRSAAVLAAGLGGGALVGIWAFAQDTLTTDRVPADIRSTSGLQLGAAIAIVSILLTAVGVAVRFRFSGQPLTYLQRRRIGIALLVLVALVPAGVTTRLAFSEKGVGGSISSAWKSLTDPKDTSRVTNDPSRLTKVASVRAKYWDEAWKIFKSEPITGIGAGGYFVARTRYRTEPLSVRHAHGYVIQTAADLGALGLATIGVLSLAWLIAARRSLCLFQRLRLRRKASAPEPVQWTHERTALAAMATIVIGFSIHSAIDWTWYVPGNVAVALLCAGWVAGRGPVSETASSPRLLAARLRSGAGSPLRWTAAAVVLACVTAIGWSVWNPYASEHALESAQLKASANPAANAAALAEVGRARKLNPLSVQPLFAEAYVHVLGGRDSAGRAALVKAVRLQPGNAEPWIQLADFTLNQLDQPREALRLLGPALHLDPQSRQGKTVYLKGLRILQQRADEAAAKREQAAERRRQARERARARRTASP